ncbi:hypothetical protein Tco_1023279, partial [Tanacetum coccineum]
VPPSPDYIPGPEVPPSPNYIPGPEEPGSGYHQKDRKPSQNDKTEHGMEKTVQTQGQSQSQY